VQNVVDLSLAADARRSLKLVLEERGLAFFVKTGIGRAPHLDARRIAWVVEAARRARTQRLLDCDALARTRRVLRRELIRQLADKMVQAGL
jgi:hypothetical protein